MAKKKKAKEIQAEVVESAHKIWLAGLGALAAAEEEGSKLFKSLVERGEGIESRGKVHVEKAKGAVGGVKVVADSYLETFERSIDDRINSVMNRLGVPSKGDLDSLSERVEDLAKAVAKIKTTEASKPRATRKPAAKKTATVKAPAAKPVEKTTAQK
jgi:poly(hydroxyalkanoate) granule-associated protein